MPGAAVSSPAESRWDGLIRKEIPSEGRWISSKDFLERRWAKPNPKPRARCGREEFRPIIDGITIGLRVLLVFIGALTLGIGGAGAQFLGEALVLARNFDAGGRDERPGAGHACLLDPAAALRYE